MGVDGYSQFDLQQSGFKGFESWNANTMAELTSNVGGSIVPGWAGPGQGEGIGGIVSAALADLETQFPSGSSLSSSLKIDGDGTVKFFNNLFSTDLLSILEDKRKWRGKITKTTPEPSATGAFLLLLALGIIRRVCPFK